MALNERPDTREPPAGPTSICRGALVVIVAAILAFAASAIAAAQSRDTGGEDQLGPVFTLSLGGKLYDDIWAVLDIPPPDGRNPAFPDPSAPARDTWRCAGCHGWDYAGADGERSWSLTGLKTPSLLPLKHSDPAIVIDKILDASHPFPVEGLPDLSLLLVAAFVSEGQYQRKRFLDKTGGAIGDTAAGQDIFEGACINCHQLDGRAYLRGESGDRSSLGWVARNRPEQALHKILNGVPMAEMLSLRFLSNQQVADLLAYLQTVDPQQQ